MTNYNYYQEVTNDIVTYLKEQYSAEELRNELKDEDDFIQKLDDELFISDSVTGNASGSYTFNSFIAKEYVLDNIDLLKESYECFDSIESLGNDFINEEWERMDVTIRLYLLDSCIPEAIKEIKKNKLVNDIYDFMNEYDFYNLQEENFNQEEIKNTLKNKPYELINYLNDFENEKSNAIINSINKYLLKK